MASRQRQKVVLISQIRKLAEIQATTREAAASVGVRHTTFLEMLRTDSRAREVWEDGHAMGCLSLRKKQLRLAETSAAMAIFLGKQMLGQNEISTIQHTGAEGGPIKTLDLHKLDDAKLENLIEAVMAARVGEKKAG